MQLLYLCNEQNTGLLDEPSRQTDILLREIAGTHDLNRLVIKEMRSLGCYQYLVIDVSALSDSEDGIIQAVESILSMYNGLRIIIFAAGHTPDHPLIQKLVLVGVCDAVTSTDRNQQQADLVCCLSGKGMIPKDAHEYHQQDYELPSQERASNGKRSPGKPVTASVYGVMHRIGTTTHALHMTRFLNEQGYKACYIEDNGQQHMATIPDLYEDAEVVEDGLIRFEGIDIFTECDLSRITRMGYDYLIYDSGVITGSDMQDMQQLLSRDIVVICAGTKPWELPYMLQLFRQSNAFPIDWFIFPSPDMRNEIQKIMGRYRERCLFAKYAPDYSELQLLYKSILAKYL